MSSQEDCLEISGPISVNGHIRCGGAKNLSTKVIIASILTKSKVILNNVPAIEDVQCTLAMCSQIGVKYVREGDMITVDASKISASSILDYKVTSRISILMFGVLMHFFDKVQIPLPSGCDLGQRKLDLHVHILERFGCTVIESDESMCVTKKPGRLAAQSVHISKPSVGATETAILLSVLADGKSIISGIAIEPEIHCLILFLQSAGARIMYSGERELVIEGVDKLRDLTFNIPGDRIEAASWACLACATHGDLIVSGIDMEHMSTFLGPYSMMGGGFDLIDSNHIRFFRAEQDLRPILLETGPYPQISTDYQPMLATLMTQASGASIIHETLFDNRLNYLQQFKLYGVDSTIYTECLGVGCKFNGQNSQHSAIIHGLTKYTEPNSVVMVDSIRNGFAYIILACCTPGRSVINKIGIIRRGISHLETKLTQAGALTPCNYLRYKQ